MSTVYVTTKWAQKIPYENCRLAVQASGELSVLNESGSLRVAYMPHQWSEAHISQTEAEMVSRDDELYGDIGISEFGIEVESAVNKGV